MKNKLFWYTVYRVSF